MRVEITNGGRNNYRLFTFSDILLPRSKKKPLFSNNQENQVKPLKTDLKSNYSDGLEISHRVQIDHQEFESNDPKSVNGLDRGNNNFRPKI